MLDLGGRQLPGKTILRSASGIGAKFSGINMIGCKNIAIPAGRRRSHARRRLQLRRGDERSQGLRLRVQPRLRRPDPAAATGWVYNVNFGIEMNGNGSVLPERCRIHMNLISGPCGKGIYINGALDSEISDNVGENAGGDFIHMGWGHRVKFHRNWDARRLLPELRVHRLGPQRLHPTLQRVDRSRGHRADRQRLYGSWGGRCSWVHRSAPPVAVRRQVDGDPLDHQGQLLLLE